MMKKKTRKTKCERETWGEKVRQMRAHVSIMTPTHMLLLQNHQRKPWGLLFSVTTKVETIRVMVALENEFGSVPSSGIFWKCFRTGDSASLMLDRNHLWSNLALGFSFGEDLFITVSLSVLVIGLFIVSISSQFSLRKLNFSKNLFISSRLSMLLAYICL